MYAWTTENHDILTDTAYESKERPTELKARENTESKVNVYIEQCAKKLDVKTKGVLVASRKTIKLKH